MSCEPKYTHSCGIYNTSYVDSHIRRSLVGSITVAVPVISITTYIMRVHTALYMSESMSMILVRYTLLCTCTNKGVANESGAALP